ncbi:DUF397 domain-containing protein [Streptomyces oceani]|uniref:DUF397 domain-containing protein n=1 Tax=Streptomyces oceani TaxID=1075402 RepID=A0A1E7KLD8_9ACTN|nr:DUF397 domain-containing protein [Streptomyces oceani]OEV04779.1 hypothetical protein AN216_05770 [Streptomyces oceani]
MSTLRWKKSSFSGQGNNCLEIGAVSMATPCVHLRESDDPGVVLSTSPAQLDALLRAAKSGVLRGISEPSR